MRKLITALLLATFMLFGAAALAEEVVLPDPAFYFNQMCEDNIIAFDAYPKAEYDAYISLLQDAYGMEIVKEETSTSYALVYLEAPGVENSRTLVGCFANSKGSGIEFDFGKSVVLNALDVYTAAALAEGVVLPDPAYYFGKEYGFGDSLITFDEYPEAEFDAYTALLIEKYGMVITDTREGDDEKSYMLSKPGIDGTKVSVSCIRESDSEQYIYFRFGESISLEKLDVYTASSACVMCGGDGVCDACGGKGYLEMKAYGSNDTVRVACTGGCAEGNCLSCAPDALAPNAKVYKAPIVGNDGLLVMSPEQYLGIEPCNGIYADNGCYIYKYDAYAAEWGGYGSDEKWAIMKSYVQALVDSGYYEISNHSKSSTSETFELRYIGPAEIVRGSFDIKVKSYAGFCNVRWRISNNVTPDDLEEKKIYFGIDDDPNPAADDNDSILKTCSVCNGDRKCRYCDGRGADGITGGDCAVCFGGKCSYCDGKGHK